MVVGFDSVVEGVDGEDEVGEVFGVFGEEEDLIEVFKNEALFEGIFDQFEALFEVTSFFLDVCLEFGHYILFFLLLGNLLQNVVEEFSVFTFIPIFVGVLVDVKTVNQEVFYNQSRTVLLASWQDQGQISSP